MAQSIGKRAIGILVATIMAAGPVLAVEPCDPTSLELSERDVARITGLEASRLTGLAAALTAPEADWRQALSGIFSNGLAPALTMPEGDYSCRTIKLGGLLPLVVYGYFSCTVTADGEALQLEKTTGSQRLSGELVSSTDGLLYRGALHYGDEGPTAYVGTSDRDQVGCLHKVSAEGESYVLELPAPAFESLHDLLVLVPEQ